MLNGSFQKLLLTFHYLLNHKSSFCVTPKILVLLGVADEFEKLLFTFSPRFVKKKSNNIIATDVMPDMINLHR